MKKIINKKGFKVGEKVMVIRETTQEDYKELFPGSHKGLWLFIYKVKKEYKISELRADGVVLSNSAVIPNHLIKRV